MKLKTLIKRLKLHRMDDLMIIYVTFDPKDFKNCPYYVLNHFKVASATFGKSQYANSKVKEFYPTTTTHQGERCPAMIVVLK